MLTKPLYQRADPAELASFNPATKVCTMNCGPGAGDSRTANERKLLCDDCLISKAQLQDKAEA